MSSPRRHRADRRHGFTVEGVLRDENLQGVEKIGLHAAQAPSRRLGKAAFASWIDASTRAHDSTGQSRPLGSERWDGLVPTACTGRGFLQRNVVCG